MRGLGYIRSISDLELAVVTVRDNVPLRVKDVARVSLGPATRRGLLDKGGAEVAGGVVIARYGANPMATILAVKEKIAQIAPGSALQSAGRWHEEPTHDCALLRSHPADP
jgi:Cu(I)/Ag(I) efflux system membrane protein CusA/SilA